MIETKFVDNTYHNRWDDYVRKSAHSTPYHLFSWNLAIRQAYGHKTFNLVAEDHERIRGVFPLCLLKPPMIVGSLYSLPYCDIGGILADNDESRSLLFRTALHLSQSLGKVNLSIRERNLYRNDASHNHDDLIGNKVSMLLHLPDSSDYLFNNFKSKLRSQIKKAVKNGLTFHYGREASHIHDFYHVFSRNMRQLGSPTHSIEWFDQIRINYENNIIIGLVKNDSLVVGAGILLVSGKFAVIPWASTLSAYNKLAPNMLLYWNFLKYACERNCEFFDFGRSTFGEGTYKFKQQWGAMPFRLDWTTYNSLGKIVSSGTGNNKLIRPFSEKIWSKLPLSITNSLGPFTRKYISL